MEGVDSKGNSKFQCQCPLAFEGALCEVKSSVVVANTPVVLEDGLIIGRCQTTGFFTVLKFMLGGSISSRRNKRISCSQLFCHFLLTNLDGGTNHE